MVDFASKLRTQRTVSFSGKRIYRYWLQIVWNEDKPFLPIIGLNPSTADETQDDPTITRCRGFAHRFGCGGLLMLNVFAYRSTDPAGLWKTDSPIGRRNVLPNLKEWIAGAGHPPVAAWGVNAHKRDPLWVDILTRNLDLYCLRHTKSGHPEHPLYLPADLDLKPWKGTR